MIKNQYKTEINGKKLVGLPPELKMYENLFSDKEKEENYEDFVDATKATANIHTLMNLPSDRQFNKELEQMAVFKKEDPSQYYEIVKKIGYGGFARVFLVKRKADGFLCALKFIEPKNDKERNIIKNELGIMMMC